jgi:hypothetical protein
MNLIADILELLPVELHAVIAMSDPVLFGVLSQVSHEWNSKLAPLARNYRTSLTICRTKEGVIRYYLNGKLHREDGPAIIWASGTVMFYLKGELHREDGPAVIWASGTVMFYLDGELHRVDGPALIYPDGTQYYYLNGKLHREDGPAIIYTDGTTEFWLNGVQRP